MNDCLVCVRSDEEIEDLASRAAERTHQGTKWPAMTYEEGVRAALDWLMGDVDEDPLDQ
jgi:hypothetical protein